MKRKQWLAAGSMALALGYAGSVQAQNSAADSGGDPNENVQMQPWSPADPSSPGAIDDSTVNSPSTGAQGPIRSDNMDSMHTDDMGAGSRRSARPFHSDQSYTPAERAFTSYLNWQRTGSEMETR